MLSKYLIFISICVALICSFVYEYVVITDNNHRTLPIIDIRCLLLRESNTDIKSCVAGHEIHRAFRDVGFAVVRNHGLDIKLIRELESVSNVFFNMSMKEKLAVHMEREPISAWRGYFSVGHEKTSGMRDVKEGLYLGVEHEHNDTRVRLGTPTFGRNKWPSKLQPRMSRAVTQYMEKCRVIAEAVLFGVAQGLGLPWNYFSERYTDEPTVLFRIFNYPPVDMLVNNDPTWATQNKRQQMFGVGEHTDYGFLTVLWFNAPGLQVKLRTTGEWLDVHLNQSDDLVVNIGDMLEMWTRGLYRATSHRVLAHHGKRGRLSFPLFYDPAWMASLLPIDESLYQISHKLRKNYEEYRRWDGRSGQELLDYASKDVVYGEFLWSKISKVFPKLATLVNPTKATLRVS